MPLLNVKILEGIFTTEEKRELARKLTDTVVSIKNENIRPVTLVIVEEIKSGDWGIAGTPLDSANAKKLINGG